jgi:hypothetical protein
VPQRDFVNAERRKRRRQIAASRSSSSKRESWRERSGKWNRKEIFTAPNETVFEMLFIELPI